MKKIYLVQSPAGVTLVEAYSRSVAINHVLKTIVKDTITAKCLTASQMLDYVGQGLEIEKTQTPKKAKQ